MTKAIPVETEIKPELFQRLMKSQDNIQSIQSMMDMFQKNCEARLSAHQKEMRETWIAIAKQHDIDVDDVVWAPRADKKNVIVPVQMRLAQNG